ncbi:siderophore-interacting protein [Nocardioides jiangxiensis]|uniref:Siderophore-interacting protein n=1 Tax=Nocardioides jiangxiensis TaxID=3064524 RepID=A0ABT9B211_9ACTN|nr:siderophore-interacting protein [Nocardioides sp. WY-20]MDO7868425.1 siderophore-interacting protein [Nocardioides sp. WY-20]
MTTSTALPMLLTEVTVAAVERLSPSFVRVELASRELADFGVDGPLLDQRIKLVFPNDAGELPSLEGADASWLGTWLQQPAGERGPMRTYTVRDVVGSGACTRVVVDIVVHEPPCGPGSTWARSARVGDRLVVLGPRRGVPFAGIEFAPHEAMDEMVLVGDETAVPAIAAILRDLPGTAVGRVLLEVPVAGDVQDLTAPPGMVVTWLPRNGAAHGTRILAAAAERLGVRVAGEPARSAAAAEPARLALAADDEVDPELWETPGYSSSGEPLDGGGAAVLPGVYAWVAGESAMVTALRRYLVRELGIDRSQVAFMGYWRRGVSMRS